jgi:hypothetical protein
MIRIRLTETAAMKRRSPYLGFSSRRTVRV